MVSNFYREEVCFTAQYPEAKGHVFTLLSYGSQDSSLENYNTSLKIYLAKTKTQGNTGAPKIFFLKYSQVSSSFTFSAKEQCTQRQVMKACLVQVTSSCDIELLFFVFTLYDTKLNQTATPDEVEEVIIIMRETPIQEKFNSTSTLIMWQQTNSF